MKKTGLLILLAMISCNVLSQRVVYSNSVILNIPSKKLKSDSVKSNNNEISTTENATIQFVDIIDSIISDKNIATEVDIEVDTIFENDERVQIINFSFQPNRETAENISDYPSGVYKLESSKVSLYLSNVVKETIQKKILSFVDSSYIFLIRIKGTSDATKIKGIRYKNEFGTKLKQNYTYEDREKIFRVTENSVIRQNNELAFLRTLGIRRFLEANIVELQNFHVNFEHYVEVSDEVGGTYRSIAIEVIIKNKI